MKKSICTVAMLALMTSGCSMLNKVEKGTKTTSYDQKGRVTSVTEDTALGDPNTDMYSAIKHVATETKENIRVRVDAIKEAVAPKQDDSKDVLPWKAAFGALAIANIEDHTDRNIKAVPVARTGYDVSETLLKEGFGFAKSATPFGAVAYMAKKWSDNAGDKTEVHASEWSQVNLTQKKTQQQSTIIATGGDGDNAGVQVPYSPVATQDSPTTSETIHEAPAATPAETPAAEE